MKALLKNLTALLLLLSLVFGFAACTLPGDDTESYNEEPIYIEGIGEIPAFSGKAWISVNDNKPLFTESEITLESFERYAPLDPLGRCGEAFACVGTDIMPTDKREGSLSSVTPTGFINKEYDIVDGGFLYNRCHLIGWQLTGENANKYNLITGTRFMNIDGMLKYENMIADYVKETGNHVMYRVTPIFEDNDLVARGVLMEMYSVEDEGEEISFCIFAYNNQPGISINYRTGESKLNDGVPYPDDEPVELPDSDGPDYIINISTKKYHLPTCQHATGNNAREYYGTEDELIQDGYEACKVCKP
ncbi:MAG: DNA/RNA non-specific endonuclease [Clostridia bacterium]|nr:DNA/RNA non-specific endonuclease [Clostridia bacterium]